MTVRQLQVLAVVALTAALWLGAIDHEVHSPADLFTLGNIPAIVIIAAIAFTILVVAWLAVTGALRAIRPRRSEGSES